MRGGCLGCGRVGILEPILAGCMTLADIYLVLLN